MGPGPGAAAEVLVDIGQLVVSEWSEWGLSEAVTDKTPSRDQRVNNKVI